MKGAELDDAMDAAVMIHDAWRREGEDEGRAAGVGDTDAFELGLRQGRELGREAGFAAGCCAAFRELSERDEARWAKVRGAVEQMERALAQINWADAGDESLSVCMETVRAKYKQACALLKLQVKPAETQNELF
jgi:hypothetical protein